MSAWLKPQPGAGSLLDRLSRLSALSEAERRLVQQVEQKARHSFPVRARLPRGQGAALEPMCILAGWAARVRDLADGRRQIVTILLPGDWVDVGARRGPTAATNLFALTPLKTADATEIQEAWSRPERFPGLAAAVDIAGVEEDHFLMHQVMRLGRQTAYERLASLLLELNCRLAARGLSTDASFSLPLTQETLADALGLSVVHVNRTLQQMRRDHVVEITTTTARLLDLAALESAAEFQPPGN